MCISCPTKKGIENLPKVGTYYKELTRAGYSGYKRHKYLMGQNIIPQKLQVYELKNGEDSKIRKRMGGHFFIKRESAVRWRAWESSHIIAAFRIKREDIEYIGETGSYGPTITAHKARRIE